MYPIMYNIGYILPVHAYAQVATCPVYYILFVFNPRIHVSCDCNHVYNVNYNFTFNPRTPMSCDAIKRAIKRVVVAFNPRTPTSCGMYVMTYLKLYNSFNPRTPVSCDGLKRPRNSNFFVIFIS